MDGSIETLLIILITLISTLTIVCLIAVVTLLVALNKLVSKMKTVSDEASETLVQVKKKLAKPAGLFVAARHIYKLVRR